MTILQRYILKQILPTAVLLIFIFTGLYIIIDIFDSLSDILSGNMPFILIAQYYFSYVPLIFIHSAPISLLLSVLFVLGKLNAHNEITAIKCSGLNPQKMVFPLYTAALIISAAVFITSEYVIPKTTRFAANIRENNFTLKNEESVTNVTFHGPDKTLFYIGSMNSFNHEFQNAILIRFNDDNILSLKIHSPGGTFSDKIMTLNNPVIEKYENGALTSRTIEKEPYIIDLNMSITGIISQTKDLELMSYRMLKRLYRFLPSRDTPLARMVLVEMYNKLFFPLLTLIIAFIAVPLSLMQKTRANILLSTGQGIIITFGFYIVYSLSQACGKGGLIAPIAAVTAPYMLFGLIGFIAHMKSA